MSRMTTTESESQHSFNVIGNQRSSVVGNEKSIGFTVGFENAAMGLGKDGIVPERLQNRARSKQTILSKEDLDEKQRLAAERKRQKDAEKVKMARKVSEDTVKFDKIVHQRIQPKWFEKGMDKTLFK
ncbi:uncharacterized protein LOC128230337 [Mya arenaria]|uniref:uncharacterized protein LOC128230337 n=1 Tax=Mya arenaria TaxID=6604 RepID=UPI0022E92F96|nr:uncharacterized protein LOC128230337 [Mya arenaria]